MKVSKKLLKTMSAVLASLMIASAFAGCGTDKETASSDTGDNTLTFWGVLDANVMRSVESYSDLMFYKEMEKRTGIHVEFIHPIAGSTGGEAFLTMLSGSELPDIAEYRWDEYTGGAQGAIDDGVIVALNDYLEEYAPNYYDYMEGEKGKANNYLYKFHSTTEEGNYYGFNRLNIGTARLFTTLYIRSDLLGKWGLEVPETIDEWTAVLAKAKSEGFKTPLTGDKTLIAAPQTTGISFHNAFGVGNGFYLNDQGKVVFGAYEKGYKEYLAQMADWVKEGYIDTNYITNNSETIIGKMVNGLSIASIGGIGGHMGKIIPAGQKLDPEFMIVACPYPVSKKGEPANHLDISLEATTIANAITTQCSNIEQAVRWCDFVYSEEGFLLKTFGLEGDTYTVEEIDGEKHYVYTDKILKPDNTDTFNITETLYKYMLPANHPGLDQHPDYLDGYYQYESQKEAIKIINKDVELAKKHMLPELNFTKDELTQKADMEIVAFDELEVALTDIALGKASIDTFDTAIKNAKKNGLDKILNIYQAAYDRYVSKFE